MSDREVLQMPSRRFWAMEQQISRLKAENDLRRVNVNRATVSKESLEDVVEHLTRELGETLEIHRERIVKPQENFSDVLTKLSGKARK